MLLDLDTNNWGTNHDILLNYFVQKPCEFSFVCDFLMSQGNLPWSLRDSCFAWDGEFLNVHWLHWFFWKSSPAALQSLWKLWNYFCFQHGSRQDMGRIWKRLLPMAEQWRILCPVLKTEEYMKMTLKLKSNSQDMACWRIDGEDNQMGWWWKALQKMCKRIRQFDNLVTRWLSFL